LLLITWYLFVINLRILFVRSRGRRWLWSVDCCCDYQLLVY